MPETLPAIFFGHGNPMNAIEERMRIPEAWGAIGRRLPRPERSCPSPRIGTCPGRGVTISTAPRTIHDFGGFPRELYRGRSIRRPAIPALARACPGAARALAGSAGQFMGARSRHLVGAQATSIPGADVPVVQLSIDETQPAAFHFETRQEARAAARRRGARSSAAATSCTISTRMRGDGTSPILMTGRSVSKPMRRT